MTDTRDAASDLCEGEMTSSARRPLVMVALDGNVEYVNDTFVESLGWSREAVLNAPASSLLADIPKAVLLDIQKTVRANRPWIGFLAYRTVTVEVFWARSNLMPSRSGKRAIAMIEPIELAEAADAYHAYRMIGDGSGDWSVHGGRVRKKRVLFAVRRHTHKFALEDCECRAGAVAGIVLGVHCIFQWNTS